MDFTINATGAQAAGQGIGNIFKALAMAPTVRQEAEAKAALQGAQIFANQQTGRLRSAQADGEELTVGARRGVEDTIAGAAGMPAYLATAYRLFGAAGGNPQQIANAAVAMQGAGFRDQAAAAVGDADPTRMNRFVSIADSKPYLPFRAVGNTGRAIDQSTGAGTISEATLARLFDREGESRIGENNAQARNASASARKTEAEIEAEAGGGRAPSGYKWTTGEDGARSLAFIPGGPADPAAKEMTEGERKAGSLLLRLRGSQQQMLAALQDDPSAKKPGLPAEFARRVPLIGDMAANSLTPEARQRVESAQLDMLDAALTLGTGAAYTREQLEGYRKSYFPQVGDKPKEIADKRVRLANIIRAAEMAAGRAEKRAVPMVTDGAASNYVRTGKDASGRRVGQRADGSMVYIDTGEEVR